MSHHVNNTGIIIQARTGSSRLPGKILLPFHKEKTLLDIIVNSIKRHTGLQVVIATTDNPSDDILAHHGDKLEVDVFRGSEQDVLQRFLDAADYYHFEHVIRVCSDNPFFNISETLELLPVHHSKQCDYTGFTLKGNLPAIKSHLGLWGEVVSYKALKQAVKSTSDPHYHEHVTNYFYEHPEKFLLCWKSAPESLFERDDIRLTLDTYSDFKLLSEMYSKFEINVGKQSSKLLVEFLDSNPVYLEKMKENIAKNRK